MGNKQGQNNLGQSDQSDSKDTSTSTLVIKSFTWSKDSHGLYDYECQQVQKNVIKLNSSGKIFRNKDDVMILKSQDQICSMNLKELINVHTSHQKYQISYPNESKKFENVGLDLEQLNDDSIWIVVKSLCQINGRTGYKLKQDDFLKLGRIRFRIKDIVSQQQGEEQKQQNQNKKQQNQINEEIKDPQKVCRICLSDTYTIDNPFVSPCKCDGSVKFVHLQCLQQWLQNKIVTKNQPYAIVYQWKNLECELCKKPFPNKLEANGELVDTIEIQKPEPPYLIFEMYSRNQNISRGIHMISMCQKTSIKIGRGSDSEVRINDISVSRFHALLRYEKGNFYILDNNSKFGTLVLVKDKFDINSDLNKLQIQVNRTVFQFSLKKNWSLMPSCCRQNKMDNIPTQNTGASRAISHRELEELQDDNDEIDEGVVQEERKEGENQLSNDSRFIPRINNNFQQNNISMLNQQQQLGSNMQNLQINGENQHIMNQDQNNNLEGDENQLQDESSIEDEEGISQRISATQFSFQMHPNDLSNHQFQFQQNQQQPSYNVNGHNNHQY